MNIDEFLTKVASEPDRTIERDVDIPNAELVEEMRRGGMRFIDLVRDPRRTSERRTSRWGHRVGAPVSADDLRVWQARFPRHVLPSDLAALLLRANGIHLWADLDTGRAYQGLAPLAEWDLARTTIYEPAVEPPFLSEKYLALTYHADHAAFVVLDVEQGRYYLMDACGPDETCGVGQTVDDLLDYLWNHRLAPRG